MHDLKKIKVKNYIVLITNKNIMSKYTLIKSTEISQNLNYYMIKPFLLARVYSDRVTVYCILLVKDTNTVLARQFAMCFCKKTC